MGIDQSFSSEAVPASLLDRREQVTELIEILAKKLRASFSGRHQAVLWRAPAQELRQILQEGLP